MGRSESPPARKRRDSSSSSASSNSSNSSKSSKEAVPSKKARMSTSPVSKRRPSPPSKFRDDRRRSRSRSPDGRRNDRQPDRRRDDRRSPPRRERRSRSPLRRNRRDSPPPRSRDDRRRDGSPPRRGGGDRDRRDRSRDRDRRRRDSPPARNDRGDNFGLTKRDIKKEVKDEPQSPPRESQLMRARDNKRREEREDGAGGKQKWGTREMWEEEERKKAEKNAPPPEDKQKVDLATSGLLASDTNTFNGVVIKYNEPQDAKIPNVRWRLYPFKGDETMPVLYIHRQSAYLVGRDRKIADLPVDHPSCSKQHAVLQYRSVPFDKPDGTRGRRIRPYIIDLGSSNGTYLNGDKVDAQRYYELKEKDVLKFGFSSREYVILTENALEHDGKAESESSSDGGVSSDEEMDEDTKK